MSSLQVHSERWVREREANPLVCVVCGHSVSADQPALHQLDAFEEHMAEEHGVDL